MKIHTAWSAKSAQTTAPNTLKRTFGASCLDTPVIDVNWKAASGASWPFGAEMCCDDLHTMP